MSKTSYIHLSKSGLTKTYCEMVEKHKAEYFECYECSIKEYFLVFPNGKVFIWVLEPKQHWELFLGIKEKVILT